MLEQLRKGTGTWVAKIFIALLVMSFAVWGIADIFTGYGGRDIATVGTTKISGEEFRQAYETQVSNMGQRFGRRLTTQQAQQLRIDQQVLSTLIGTAALNQQAQDLKLGITDKAIARSIENDPSFRGFNGKFSRDRFNELIRMNGLSEQGYIFRQRNAEIRNQIIKSLFSSIKLPQIYLDAVDRFSEQTRVLKYFNVPATKAGNVPAPNDETLKKFFESHTRLFTAPEYRKIGLLLVEPEAIKKSIALTEKDIKAAYDANPDRFNKPEQRRVQQIAFPSEDSAKKAYTDLQSGKSFEDVAVANGFSKTEIDLGVISPTVLADKKIRAAAFALKKGKFSAPVKGELAMVIVKVSKIIPAVKSNYNEVKAKIKDEMLLDRAQNKVQDLLDQIEDERAGGANLSEISNKLKLNYRLVETIDRSGNDIDGKLVKDLIEQEKVLRSAFGSDVGVETEAVEVAKGGYEWVEVLDVVPAKLKEFETVKTDVKAEYIKIEKASRLRKFAGELVQRLKDGEQLKKVARSIGTNVKTSKPIKRGQAGTGLSNAVINQAFTLAKNSFGNGSGEKDLTRVIFHVSEIIAPKARKPEDTEKLTAELSRSLLGDMLAQFVGGLQSYYKVNVNENLYKRLTGRDQS